MPQSVSALAPRELVDRARKGIDLLASVRRVRILTHYDADGSTAAAILARVREEEIDLLLVADMGSGQLDLLETVDAPVVVLDHHKPLRDAAKAVHVNPHLVGIDGARGACGATLAWFFALLMDEANWDLAPVAMAGAIADRQHLPDYDGLNAALFAEAVERKLLARERGLVYPDRPLAEAIAHRPDPYLVGLTGRPEAVADVLRELAIDPEARPRDLPQDARRRLASHLAVRLARQGARPDAIRTLVEDKYWSESVGLYADELAAFVNAAARMHREGVGIRLCLGDGEALREAKRLHKAYTEELIAALRKLEADGPHDRQHLQFFYVENGALAGQVAGIAMQTFLDQARPTLALAVTDGTTKVSARGTKDLIDQGIDLAAALRGAADSVGGVGGGHDIAAGATVPRGKEDAFLDRVDEIVASQRSSADVVTAAA